MSILRFQKLNKLKNYIKEKLIEIKKKRNILLVDLGKTTKEKIVEILDMLIED